MSTNAYVNDVLTEHKHKHKHKKKAYAYAYVAAVLTSAQASYAYVYAYVCVASEDRALMSRKIAMHVRFESWYISLPTSTKQQHELTKFYLFWWTQTAMANFLYLL